MRRGLIILFVLIGLNKSFGQDRFWEIRTTMPNPVAGASEWVENRNIYVIGGYSDSTQANTNWIQKYDIDLDEWSTTFMIEPRFGFVSDRYGEKFLLFGGIHDSNSISNTLEAWNGIYTDEIVFKNENFSRVFASGLVHNNNFYIFGGNPLTESVVDSLPYIVEYNLIDSAVTFELNDFFTPAGLPEQQMCALVGDDVYIFGGVINGISQKIYKFNTIDHSFKRLPVDLITPRAAGQAVVGLDPNKIMIIGGYNESNPALSGTEIFSIIDTNYFVENGPPLNIPRSHFTASFIDGTIFVFGGYGNDGKLVSEAEIYNELDITEFSKDNYGMGPEDFYLFQNYPNPFNPSTTISYRLPLANNFKEIVSYRVNVKVYDVLGREVAVLVNQYQEPGEYRLEFNADHFSLPSGIYYYSIMTDEFINTKKMILLK